MSKHHATGRAQGVIAYLLANPTGATIRQLIEQVAPDCTQAQMSGTVATLVSWKKLRAKDRTRPFVYVATREATIDRRRYPTPKAAPGPVSVPRAAASPLPPAPRGRVAPADRAKTQASDQIAADVAAFLAAGGRIERLPNGATSTPLKTHPLRAANDAAWLERQARLAIAD